MQVVNEFIRFNGKLVMESNMDTRPKVDVLERLESALQQRTCIWSSDIELAIKEIKELRAQVLQQKDSAHLKKLNKIKEVE